MDRFPREDEQISIDDDRGGGCFPGDDCFRRAEFEVDRGMSEFVIDEQELELGIGRIEIEKAMKIGDLKIDRLYWKSYPAKLIRTILRNQTFKNKEISEKLK